MGKQIFEKIISGGVLDVKDMTADEKKALYACMQEYGMPGSTAYLRFFSKGFSPWELFGVAKLKNVFLATTPCCVDDNGIEDSGSRGYGYVLTLAQGYDDSKFYEVVTDLKMGVRLCNFMADRGMTSQTTVRNRFKANDWKPWEIKGIESILSDFINNSNESSLHHISEAIQARL